MNNIKQRYESFAYDAYPLAQTHPVHLATRGQHHKLTPVDPGKCRYLEIGCANGRNLIDMAYGLPGSEFVGIDLSENAIAEGQAVIERLSLKNVKLIACDLMDYPLDTGPFDYIVSHGLYSWIPQAVRERLWLIMEKLLSPHGLAYLSYNVYPGCYLRRMLREMMLFHVHQYESPQDKLQQAQAFLKFLDGGLAIQNEFGMDVRKEIDELLHHRRDSSIYHDDLSLINEPVYFHQVVSAADLHQLQYVSECTYLDCTTIYFPEDIQQQLKQLEDSSYLVKEQYLDFLKLRRFRSSLFCRRELLVDYRISSERLSSQFFASNSRIQGDMNWDKESAIKLISTNSASISLNHPLSKAVLFSMIQTFPRYWSLDELRRHGSKLLCEKGITTDETEDWQELNRTLLICYSVGLVDAKCIKPNVAHEVPEKPSISAIMREQLNRGLTVLTNQLHMPVEFETDFMPFLLLCDGTRTRQDLINAPVSLPELENLQHHEKVDRILKQLIPLAIFEASSS
jgi:methyltransferase-like protein